MKTYICYAIVPKNIFNSENNADLKQYIQYVERQQIISNQSISETRISNPNDYYGKRVAISEQHAIFGTVRIKVPDGVTPDTSFQGSAYIFTPNESGEWIQQQQLVTSDNNSIVSTDKQVNDNFGYSVAINNDYAFVELLLTITIKYTVLMTTTEILELYMFSKKMVINGLKIKD